MRKLVALIAAVAVVGAIAIPALAQTTPETKITVKAKVTPNKAGTKKNPRGVKLFVDASWETTPGFEPPVVTSAKVYFPEGSLYNGGKYPSCSFRKIDRPAGPRGCPKKSIMGSADVVALADRTPTRPDVTIVNAGKAGVCLYTVLYHPALVQKCVRGPVTKLTSAQGNKLRGSLGFKPQYFMRIIVPEDLQVVAGVPIAIRSFKSVAGGKPYAKEWIATTGCPKNRKWGFSVETFYLYNAGTSSEFTQSSVYQDSIPCRK